MNYKVVALSFNQKGILTVKAYIRRITPKAWYLIGCSIVYLLTILVLSFFFPTPDAIFYAQILFVFMLAVGLAVLKTYRWYQRR